MSQNISISETSPDFNRHKIIFKNIAINIFKNHNVFCFNENYHFY